MATGVQTWVFLSSGMASAALQQTVSRVWDISVMVLLLFRVDGTVGIFRGGQAFFWPGCLAQHGSLLIVWHESYVMTICLSESTDRAAVEGPYLYQELGISNNPSLLGIHIFSSKEASEVISRRRLLFLTS